MKILSRDFTTKEKALLLVLILILLGLAYYQFVDQPVRASLAEAAVQKENLQVELDAVKIKIARLEKMQAEIDRILASGEVSQMPSYNNSKRELAMLNDVLASANQYSVSFSNVTRNGDQIRRNFSLQFSASDYGTVKQILAALAGSLDRCMIGDIQCTPVTRNYYRGEYINETVINVSATATFYETMVGGTPDAGLPTDSAAG